ncbi:MAG: transposase [Oscillospiraceae bacterium]|nr:transposase [Oscillospiraceae bacterium]
MTILIAVFSTGYHGKTVDFANHSDCHRTTLGYFLNHGKWDETILETAVKMSVLSIIYEEAKRSGKPVFCIVDDTISSKTVPSSKAEFPIESAEFHYSHLKGKSDYGHQAIAVLLSCNGITLLYAIKMYNKSVSKIDMMCEIAQKLPTAPTLSYLLCDRWYTCKKLMEAFIKKGFYTVGALKTNRILYPNGIRKSVRKLAEILKEKHAVSSFRSVTVKGRKYYVYQYEGNLHGIENAVVLLTFPEGKLFHMEALRAFLCTDASLSDTQILSLYVQRWEIEVFFRESKRRLAFDKYQIRSAKGIQRFWIIASLAHLLACCSSSTFHFSEGYKIIVSKIQEEQITFIFHFAQNGGSLPALLDMIH